HRLPRAAFPQLGRSLNPNTGLNLVENQTLLWEKDGTGTDLGRLGGAGGIAGNHAVPSITRVRWLVIRSCSTTQRSTGFLWTRRTGMQDLGGALLGDCASFA